MGCLPLAAGLFALVWIGDSFGWWLTVLIVAVPMLLGAYDGWHDRHRRHSAAPRTGKVSSLTNPPPRSREGFTFRSRCA